MSMLSAQIDKLRHEADMLRDHGTFIGYGGLTSTDPEMIECADLMCDAADTIWELRESVHRERAEADTLRTQLADVTESMGRVEERCAKLRERVAELEELLPDSGRWYRAETVEAYVAEIAKLREFMSDILTYGYGGGFLCSNGGWSCPHFQECFNCPVEEGPEQYVRRGCKWLALARELGIEVAIHDRD